MDVSWLITNPSQLAALHCSRAEGFLSQPPPMDVPLGRRSREIPCSSRSSLSLLHASEIVLSISFSEDFPPSEGPQTQAVPLISAAPVIDSFLWPLVSALSPQARPKGLEELVKGMAFPGAFLV